MNVLMTGATGLIGSQLTRTLAKRGYRVIRLRRSSPSSLPVSKITAPATSTVQRAQDRSVADVSWSQSQNDLLPALSETFGGAVPQIDAVVNLAGASIADGRWTERRKQVLHSSRVATTRELVAGLGQLPAPPPIFLSASAIGYYGDRGEEILSEESGPGSDFLAKLAHDWEAEAAKAEAWGSRVVQMRFGIVLAVEGGALREMMQPFRFGVGGKLASGRQWMSWIQIEDVVCAVQFLLEHRTVHGPVNFVSPECVRNACFAKELGKAMRRPAFFGAPAAALRLMLGREMADALLGSQRVVPKKLQESGYQFLQPHLDAALHGLLCG